MEKWSDVIKALNQRKVSDSLKKAEFLGLPFGEHKVRISPKSSKKSVMSWRKPYTGTYPIQGTWIFVRVLMVMKLSVVGSKTGWILRKDWRSKGAVP